jgi:hypothetical protein
MRNKRDWRYIAIGVSWAVVLFLLFSCSQMARAQSKETGSIAGRLINKTESGSDVFDVEISLRHFVGEGERDQKTTKTDLNGNFQFDGLPRGSNDSYSIRAYYMGGEYNSEQIVFKDDQSHAGIDMVVFDSTDEDKAIKVKAYHMFVDVQQNIFSVQEIIIVENRIDRTYIGKRELSPGTRETFKVSLPGDASAIQYFKGLKRLSVRRTEDGLVDTLSIMPGVKQIVLTYKVNYDSSNLGLKKAIYFDTENFSILTPVSGVQLQSDHLSKGKVVSFGEKDFLSYSGENLAKGTVLSLRFSNLPAKKTHFLWLIVGLAIIAIFAMFLIPTLLRRKAESKEVPGEEGGEVEAKAEDKMQELLVKLARLDEIFEEGLISEKSYQEERNNIKETLLKMKAQETPAKSDQVGS